MKNLLLKFKALFTIARPLEAFVNVSVVVLSMIFISGITDTYTIILSSFVWLFISFSNHLIKEYYETLKLRLIFPGNTLVKEIISPAEAMIYYTYFTISAVFLASYIGTYTLIIAIATTLFNQFSSKRCRKNPYRFPFSRGIIAVFMLFYSATYFSNLSLFYFIAAVFCILTYIITFLDYSRYYDEITDKSAKFFLSFLIPFLIFVITLPFTRKFYNSSYIYLVIPTIISLLYVFKNILISYKNSNINLMVWLLRFNLPLIIIAIYTGLK